MDWIKETLPIIGTIAGFVLYLWKEGIYNMIKKLIKEVKELIAEAEDLLVKYKELKVSGFTEKEIEELFNDLQKVIKELQDVIIVSNNIWKVIKKRKQIAGSKQIVKTAKFNIRTANG